MDTLLINHHYYYYTIIVVIIDYISCTNETVILVTSDQEKAFDRVDRFFLVKLLPHFGFRSCFCKWITTLCNGAFTHVIVNGFL